MKTYLLYGVIALGYVLVGLYLPAYVAIEALPPGWASDENIRTMRYWWAVPTLIVLTVWCAGTIIVTIGLFCMVDGRSREEVKPR